MECTFSSPSFKTLLGTCYYNSRGKIWTSFLFLNNEDWQLFLKEVPWSHTCASKSHKLGNWVGDCNWGLSYLPFYSVRKCPRVGRDKSAFPLSVIIVFKNTYFRNSMALKYKPTSSSGAHLLENQKENWLYLGFQQSIFLKAFQELFCLHVIFHLLTAFGIWSPSS